MIVYKGFNADMTCTPAGKKFQFAEGESYHEDKAKLCERGFHACEMPLDCLKYYSPATSVYHVCELEGVTGEKKDDTKVCGTDIKIGARLDIAGLVKEQIDWVKSKTGKEKNSRKDQGAASATGDLGAASATGEASAAMAVGRRGRVMGALGCALFCVERGEWDGDTYPIKSVCAGIVDGVNLRPDVWYMCVDGKFVEVKYE